MKKDDFTLVISIALVAGFISLLIASSVFGKQEHNLKAPQVDAIKAAFPDAKTAPTYQAFLNEKALDPTQPIQIGNTKNSAPFNQ